MEALHPIQYRNAELETELRLLKQQLAAAHEVNRYLITHIAALGSPAAYAKLPAPTLQRDLDEALGQNEVLRTHLTRAEGALTKAETRKEAAGEKHGQKSASRPQSRHSEGYRAQDTTELSTSTSGVITADNDLIHLEEDSSSLYPRSSSPSTDSSALSASRTTTHATGTPITPFTPRFKFPRGSFKTAGNSTNGQCISVSKDGDSTTGSRPVICFSDGSTILDLPDPFDDADYHPIPRTQPRATCKPQFRDAEYGRLFNIAYFIEGEGLTDSDEYWRDYAAQRHWRTPGDWQAYYRQVVRPDFLAKKARPLVEKPVTMPAMTAFDTATSWTAGRTIESSLELSAQTATDSSEAPTMDGSRSRAQTVSSTSPRKPTNGSPASDELSNGVEPRSDAVPEGRLTDFDTISASSKPRAELPSPRPHESISEDGGSHKQRDGHSPAQETESKPHYEQPRHQTTTTLLNSLQLRAPLPPYKYTGHRIADKYLIPGRAAPTVVYVPQNGEDHLYRTVLITNIPQMVTLAQVIDRVRGGKLVSATLVDTSRMRLGSITNPPIGTNTAMVVFVQQDSAMRFFDWCKNNKFYSSHSTPGQKLGYATVELVRTPTHSLKPWLSSALIDGLTRCIDIYYLQKAMPAGALQEILYKERRGRHAYEHAVPGKPPLKATRDEAGIVHLEFQSALDAKLASNILAHEVCIGEGKVQWGFVADPCDRPFSVEANDPLVDKEPGKNLSDAGGIEATSEDVALDEKSDAESSNTSSYYTDLFAATTPTTACLTKANSKVSFGT